MSRRPKYDDDQILDRAMATFWRHGWSQTSIRDLERAVDLKAPSIYRRVGSKDGLGAAVVDHYVGRVVRRRVGRYLSGVGDPIDNISAFLERSVTQPDAEQRLWGCLLTTAAVEAEHLDGEVGAAIERGLAEIERGLLGEVERAARSGQLAIGVEPASAVAMLTLVMQGLMAMARGGVSAGSLQRRARAAVSTIARRS